MHVHVCSVPYDSGVAGVRMGRGPVRLLDGGLLDHLRAAGHEASASEIRASPADVPSELATAFDLNRQLAAAVESAMNGGAFPLTLAGSCYTALGTMAGLAGEPVGVVWLDTHADLNTPETTTSGFLDGMAVSILSGRCFGALARSVPGHRTVPDDELLLVGTRDLDPAEAVLIEETSITVLRPGEVDRELPDALRRLAGRVARVYVHLDLDVLDPAEARANALAAPNGLSVGALVDCLGRIRDSFSVAAMALTAYDPEVDPDGRVVTAAFAALDAVLG